MQSAKTSETVLPGVFRWEQYSPEHKVVLTSHAIVRDGRIFVFDPIPLAAEPMEVIAKQGAMAAIILTNENHERDAAAWRDRFNVPVWVAAEATLSWPDLQRLRRSEPDWDGWRLEWLDGAAGGELVFRWDAESLVICGDAVVNLPGRGLELLPAKYCRNQVELKQSLRKLVAVPFERLLMAHGRPFMQLASQQLAKLL